MGELDVVLPNRTTASSLDFFARFALLANGALAAAA